MDNELISVIVPIYNVEKFLVRCVDSIINQTYTNLEIILVDDGSPDKCGEMCDDYAEKDARIKVIHKENGGLSDARNAGIKIASGEYITFVDSDDYISVHMIEHLYSKIEQYGADIAECGFQNFHSDYANHEYEVSNRSDRIFSGLRALEALFVNNKPFYVAACAKLYKKNVFNEMENVFPQGRINEDIFTTYKLFYNAKAIALSKQRLYYYYKRDDSIMGQSFSLQRMDAIIGAEEAMDFVKSNNLPLSKQVKCYYIRVNISTINSAVSSKNWRQWTKELKQMRNNIFSVEPTWSLIRYMPPYKIAVLAALRLGYWCYIPLRRVYEMLNK